MQKDNTALLGEFLPVSKEEWLQQLKKDLKGQGVNEALIRQDSIEQIDFPSYFHWSEQQTASIIQAADCNEWIIRQRIDEANAQEVNASALKRLNEGCSGLGFPYVEKPEILLNNIQCEYIYTDFAINSFSEAENMAKFLPLEAQTTFCYDPVLQLNTEEVCSYFKQIQHLKNLRSIEVNNLVFAESGANCSQQLGIFLSQLNEYFHLLSNDFSIEVLLQNMQCKIGIGQQFIFEVAKCRALRLLVQNLVRGYDAKATASVAVHAVTMPLNKSLADPYTNLLRLTTEGMSAAIGGANIISLLPYDFWSEKGASDFAYRMSTNISHILKEESYLNAVLDASAGSYAIEYATKAIAEKAWLFFNEIEQQGGFVACMKNGFLKREVTKTRSERIRLHQEKIHKLIGINCFENPEKMNAKWKEMKADFPFQALVLEQLKGAAQ